MNRTRKNPNSSLCLLALGAAVVPHTTTSHGAAIAPNTPFSPGVTLDPALTMATSSLAGTIVGDQTVAFSESMNSWFTGTLRSLVVMRDDNSKLDFYYQLINTTASEMILGDAEIFALGIESFAGYGFGGALDTLDAVYRTDGLTGLNGVGSFVNGTVAPVTGYRDPMAADSIGFDFATDADMPLFDPTNLKIGETSNFMIVRTNATEFANAPAFVMGNFGTAVSNGFAPVPEPATAGLMAIGALGLAARRRCTSK